ncbi:MAG: phosphate acyltransferase [Acidobacteria bacterium RIFCSPHIGHO2_12_FULL_67_30]|nr:MAG: phosphate acyltransferase [Acidobacteria bacterium RIFCSPHIGHO2_01_FULL_67_28]OFV86881.1 MAG: phosphate acyltransferase [Acidobacteria bacterium RIFCSPHIGHO2_12_FULL_67_30]
MTTIAVDAMGSDHAPQVEVEGAVLAARDYGVAVQLVGQPALLERHLARQNANSLPISIVPASDVIAMDESPVKALRRKPEASVRLTALQVREGKAQGMVSAGNTGAAMAAAKMELGTLPGVDRPALASVFPTKRGTPAVLVDVGANVDCRPQHLHQFAIMGEVYYRVMFGVARPRVGLLSIGEEASKGNEVVRETHKRLKETPLSFDFVGNVEGRDLYGGDVHVIVCDGFIGNVALKISEGMVEAIMAMLKEAMSSNLTAQVGYVLSRQAYDEFKRRLDYSEYGGAPLLGIRGVCVICHGRSNANAIKNAIRVAAGFSDAGINEKIEKELALVAK